MNTLFSRAGLIAGSALMLISPAFAAPPSGSEDMLAHEQKLVSGVEIENKEPEENLTFWERMTRFYTDNEPEDERESKLEPIPIEIGEEEGFWTRVQKAFAYKVQPQKEDNKRAIEINVLMIEGRQRYRSGEYRQALETFKDVIQRDPYNITARRYIRECQESLMKITLDDFDIVRRERLQDVERAWLLRPLGEKEVEAVTGEAAMLAARAIDRNVEQILPSVQFIEAKLPVVFEHLYQISDPKVSIVTDPAAMSKLGEEKRDTITLKLANVPLIEVIKYICGAKGLTYRVDVNAVVISGKGTVSLKRKVFQLSRSLDMIELPDVEGGSPSKKVKELFKRIGIPETEGATVTYDTRNNRLIVQNTDANLKIIEEFINRYSETPPQVQIEARFVTIRNDDMSQLVFRFFLTKNYRWNRKDKYGDRFYLEAPNKQRELTPGLRYIRSFMDETSYDPLATAYELPSLVSTGNEYEDYMRSMELRPHQPAYSDQGLDDIESAYTAIEQQKAAVREAREQSNAEYKAYQGFLKSVQPQIAAGGPVADVYENQLATMYTTYTQTLAQSYLPALATLDTYKQRLARMDAQNKTINDGLGKIFDIQGVLGPAEYRAVIYALDNAEGIHTIFAPKVTVLNGQRAEIKDVTRLRYNKTIEEAEDQDVDVGDAYSVVYDYAVTPKEWDDREYGTRLIVTPSVQADDRTIELDVQPEVSDLIGFRQFVSSRNNVYELPQFFVQSVKTTVSINDGDTLVMGGLMRDELVRTKDKIPIIADLPWIGRFWRSESEVARKSNLMIFITAKLIDPSGQVRRRTTAVR